MFWLLQRYKALKLQEASALQASESVCTSADDQTKDTESPCGSSLSDPAISNSRLVSTGAAPVQDITGITTSKVSNNNSSSSSTPPSPNQQPAPGSPTQSRDMEEDAVTEEPDEDDEVLSCVPEEKTSRGRGRTPAKKRGRGGRRR